MVHDARIIPVNPTPRLGLPSWMGESRGRWDGDTLVIETKHFHQELPSFSGSFFSAVGTAEQMQLTEKFTRVDEDTLRYEFTVTDPATYTAPITAVMLMKRIDGRIYEYACHEGNYGLYNILAGAQREARAAR